MKRDSQIHSLLSSQFYFASLPHTQTSTQNKVVFISYFHLEIRFCVQYGVRERFLLFSFLFAHFHFASGLFAHKNQRIFFAFAIEFITLKLHSLFCQFLSLSFMRFGFEFVCGKAEVAAHCARKIDMELEMELWRRKLISEL